MGSSDLPSPASLKASVLSATGEKLDFKEFSVQVIESVHRTVMRRGVRHRPKFEEITKPWVVL